MTVAYLGVEGTFSHEACLRFLPDHQPVPHPTFSEVVSAVRSREADLGILPIANNDAGETGARALIEKAGLRVIDEAVLPIRMHLLGLPEATVDQITTVVSHPIALRQCSEALKQLGVKTEEISSTALAARSLKNPNRAVLASETAAGLYGLAVLRRDVHNRSDNATSFAIVSAA